MTADEERVPRHYPAHLMDVQRLPGARRLLLRPILPQDHESLAELMADLSPAARRNRFHGMLRPSGSELRRMCTVDYRRHLALTVSVEAHGTEQIVAEARYCVATDDESAEFAVLVHEAWQRRGIGTWTICTLERAARDAGLNWLTGTVLRDNKAMLRLLRRLGFVLTPDRTDERLIQAERRLDKRVACGNRCVGIERWLRRSASWLSVRGRR